MDTKAHGPVYADNEEHLVRRIGVAVALLWHVLPEETRRTILEQAAFVGDRHATVQLERQLSEFLETYAGRAEQS